MVKWFDKLNTLIERDLKITPILDKEAYKVAGEGTFAISIRDGRANNDNAKTMVYSIIIDVFKSDFTDFRQEVEFIDLYVPTLTELIYINMGSLGLTKVDYIDFNINKVAFSNKVIKLSINYDITFVYRNEL